MRDINASACVQDFCFDQFQAFAFHSTNLVCCTWFYPSHSQEREQFCVNPSVPIFNFFLSYHGAIHPLLKKNISLLFSRSNLWQTNLSQIFPPSILIHTQSHTHAQNYLNEKWFYFPQSVRNYTVIYLSPRNDSFHPNIKNNIPW